MRCLPHFLRSKEAVYICVYQYITFAYLQIILRKLNREKRVDVERKGETNLYARI